MIKRSGMCQIISDVLNGVRRRTQVNKTKPKQNIIITLHLLLFRKACLCAVENKSNRVGEGGLVEGREPNEKVPAGEIKADNIEKGAREGKESRRSQAWTQKPARVVAKRNVTHGGTDGEIIYCGESGRREPRATQ